MTWQSVLLAAAAVVIVIAVTLAEPIPQDLLYHQFSDQEQIGGIPNAINVVSNLPFLIVGMLGLKLVGNHGDSIVPQMKLAWLLFFFGVSMTAIGSGYYHLNPSNGSLVWDRLPMTVGFMSLVAVIIAEYHSPDLGRKLLLPLLMTGIASVLYWAWTESQGRGDLRPYVVVQFLPMLLLPLTVLLFRDRSDLGRYIWWMLGFYVLAKLAEFYDNDIYGASRFISGHSVKHIIAALAPACLYYALLQRHAGIGSHRQVQLQRQPPLR